MYKEFYNLRLSPFKISCDPAFMWFGEKHQEALATLKYGILDNKGFLLLTGDVGTGKTSLINTLIQSLGQDILHTSVPDPSLIKLDFFNYIATSFGIDKEFTSKGAFLFHFKNFLLNAAEKNKKVLLIIDEAQLLAQEMLEEIRLLSNIEKPDAKLINIFFIGQNEFNEILNRPQNRAVLQRMTLNFNLAPLIPEEVDAYIRHRLKVAGTQERIFDRDAVQEIFLYSGGFPRRINILCDHALLSGFVKEQRLIDAKIVNECAKELKIPVHVDNRDLNPMFDEPRAYPSNKNNAPKESSSKTFMSHSPAQHPNAPSPPVQQQKNKLFSWDKLVILILFFLFAWYLIFPDHFVSTLSQVKQSVNRRQNIPTEQKTGQAIQPGKRLGVQNPKPPETDNPSSGDNNAEKKASERAENPGELMFAIKTPETDMSSGQKSPPPPLSEEKITVRFKSNGDAIIENDLKKLEALSKSLVAHQNSKILITGYTDAMENGTYNVKLSEFRANIVKSFLLGMGVKNYQMKIQGRGGQDPIEGNDTVWGRMMNRRVEIEMIN